MKTPKNCEAVVKALGGPTNVGLLVGQPAAGVCNWYRRNSLKRFPPKYYFVMKKALKQKGYKAPRKLWGFVEPT